MWCGHSDNQKICRIARSILTSGFLQAETAFACTMDMSTTDGLVDAPCLMFGEGQARGLAARLAWHILEDALSQGTMDADEST